VFELQQFRDVKQRFGFFCVIAYDIANVEHW